MTIGALDQFDVLIKMMTDMMIVSATFAGSHLIKLVVRMNLIFNRKIRWGGAGFIFPRVIMSLLQNFEKNFRKKRV